MAIFTNKKHTSSLYSKVSSAIKADPMISKGGKRKQSSQKSMGDRKFDPMLKLSGNQGLQVKGTIDMMIAKAIK
jgi:hypothetical protein|tara:strand:- start:493 stop:714 length:222 start_codon:yes stop_codon:yes gene_type:complete